MDLSLARTGVAGDGWHTVVKSTRTGDTYADRGRRIHGIATELATYTLSADLVVLEGPSYGHGMEVGTWDRGGLWWQVVLTLQAAGVPYAIVSPAALKRYATGKGNASKDDMMREVSRRFPWFDGDNNEADAVGLAAMGYARLGRPLTELPEHNRQALDRVEWPPLPIDGVFR